MNYGTPARNLTANVQLAKLTIDGYTEFRQWCYMDATKTLAREARGAGKKVSLTRVVEQWNETHTQGEVITRNGALYQVAMYVRRHAGQECSGAYLSGTSLDLEEARAELRNDYRARFPVCFLVTDK